MGGENEKEVWNGEWSIALPKELYIPTVSMYRYAEDNHENNFVFLCCAKYLLVAKC